MRCAGGCPGRGGWLAVAPAAWGHGAASVRLGNSPAARGSEEKHLGFYTGLLLRNMCQEKSKIRSHLGSNVGDLT